MKKLLTLSVLGFALALVSARAAETGDNIIYWMLDDPVINEVGGSGTTTLAELEGRGAADGLAVEGVRVSMRRGDGTLLGYLNLKSDNDWTDMVWLPGIEESASGEETEKWAAGPTSADISRYSAELTADPEISFMIEVGAFKDDLWMILAKSEAATLGELKENGYVFASELDMQTHLPWTGVAYSVPEPSGGLLLALGAALLALRRRRSLRACA